MAESGPWEDFSSAPKADEGPWSDYKKTEQPKSDFSWSQAVTDIPHEIYQEGANAAGDIGALAHRSEMGPVEGLMATGKAALAVPRLLAAPVTGAARSLLGHGMANTEHGITSLINPDIAAKQDPTQMYEESKGDVDKAMMAARPAGAPVRVPAVGAPPLKYDVAAGKPTHEWEMPTPKVKPTGVVEQPETSDFFESADKRYNNMRGYGVEFDKKPIAGIADNAITELETDGYRDYLAPKTYKALDELRNVKGQNATISDIEGVRKLLNKIRKDPAERDAAATAVGHIDDYLTNLHNNSPDVVVNNHFADRISEEAKAARSDWGAAKRSAAIDEALERSENAASVHGNIGHQIQLQLKNLRNNRKEMKFWTDDEKAELDAAVKGTTVSKMAKQAGKFSPHGVVSTAGAIALGHAVMPGVGGVAVPAAGFVAKKIANYMAKGRAEKLGNYVKGRSAFGRENSTNAAAQAATKAISKSSRPSLASSVAASVPRLTVRPSLGQIQGLVPSTAQEQQKGRGGRNEEPDDYTEEKTHAIVRAIGGAVNHNSNPSEAQKKAGNYAKTHKSFHGMDISIENLKGSNRSGVGKDGKEWKVKMPAHYGYIKRTEGADGDHVDCYLGPNGKSDQVFVVDQKDHETGRFDEHKCLLGFNSEQEAKRTYLAGFSDGKNRIKHMRRMSMSEFKDWLSKGDTSKQIRHHELNTGGAVRRAIRGYD